MALVQRIHNGLFSPAYLDFLRDKTISSVLLLASRGGIKSHPGQWENRTIHKIDWFSIKRCFRPMYSKNRKSTNRTLEVGQMPVLESKCLVTHSACLMSGRAVSSSVALSLFSSQFCPSPTSCEFYPESFWCAARWAEPKGSDTSTLSSALPMRTGSVNEHIHAYSKLLYTNSILWHIYICKIILFVSF